jgi:NDP-sugar pyrophosphorylase family protein
VESGARLTGPAYIGAGSVVKDRAVIEPFAVLGANCRIEEGATVGDSVLWANVRVGEDARVRGALVGRSAHIGHHSVVDRGVVLGDKSVITDYSRIAPAE